MMLGGGFPDEDAIARLAGALLEHARRISGCDGKLSLPAPPRRQTAIL
jgi:hypothetical protein